MSYLSRETYESQRKGFKTQTENSQAELRPLSWAWLTLDNPACLRSLDACEVCKARPGAGGGPGSGAQMGLWAVGSLSGPPRAVCGWARCGWAPASSSPGSVYASVAGPRAPASIPESCPEKAATAGQPDRLRVHDSLDQRLHGPAAPECLPRLVSPRGCWEGPRLHPAPRLLTHGRPGRAQADGRVTIARAPGSPAGRPPPHGLLFACLGCGFGFLCFVFSWRIIALQCWFLSYNHYQSSPYIYPLPLKPPPTAMSIHLSPPS